MSVVASLALALLAGCAPEVSTNSQPIAVTQVLEYEPPPPKPAPAFEFVDQSGQLVTRESLLGQVWIADFFFTQCTSICPSLTARFVLLQQRLGAPDLRFVSFSVDPEHDTPAALATYASQWNPDEKRWSLLATDEAGVHDVARGFDVWVKATGDAEDPIVHTGRFLLVGRDGLVVGSYNSEDDAAIERLIEDTTKLVSSWDKSMLHKLEPAQLFTTLGCAGCHGNTKLAPSLEGLGGSTVELDGKPPRVADDDYLRESITSPVAAIVAGYRGTMPNYRSVVDETLLERLVTHVKSFRASSAAPEPAVKLALDPVCDGEITVAEDTPWVDHEGTRYYFCCGHCANAFRKNPKKFLED